MRIFWYLLALAAPGIALKVLNAAGVLSDGAVAALMGAY